MATYRPRRPGVQLKPASVLPSPMGASITTKQGSSSNWSNICAMACCNGRGFILLPRARVIASAPELTVRSPAASNPTFASAVAASLWLSVNHEEGCPPHWSRRSHRHSASLEPIQSATVVSPMSHCRNADRVAPSGGRAGSPSASTPSTNWLNSCVWASCHTGSRRLTEQ